MHMSNTAVCLLPNLSVAYCLCLHKANWLCTFLCLPAGTSPEGPLFGPPLNTIGVTEIKEVISACERGIVVVLDKDVAVLNRVWPLYEVGGTSIRQKRGCEQKYNVYVGIDKQDCV